MYKRCERCCKITDKLINDFCKTCFVLCDKKHKREELIMYKGGKCERCGYDKYHRCLVFHHTNPTAKKSKISSSNLDIEKLKKEADKCQLLCIRCHQEEHELVDKVKREKKLEKQIEVNTNIDFDKFVGEKLAKHNKQVPQSECLYCKQTFKNPTNRKFCSVECRKKCLPIKTYEIHPLVSPQTGQD